MKKKEQVMSMSSSDGHRAQTTFKKGEAVKVVIEVDGKVVMAMSSNG